MYIDFRGLGSFLTTTPAHKYDKDGKNYASRHRNPDFDFEWACVSICIWKGEEIREAIKTFDLDQ